MLEVEVAALAVLLPLRLFGCQHWLVESSGKKGNTTLALFFFFLFFSFVNRLSLLLVGFWF